MDLATQDDDTRMARATLPDLAGSLLVSLSVAGLVLMLAAGQGLLPWSAPVSGFYRTDCLSCLPTAPPWPEQMSGDVDWLDLWLMLALGTVGVLAKRFLTLHAAPFAEKMRGRKPDASNRVQGLPGGLA